MQEIDIPPGLDINLLSFKGYNLITENNQVKPRVGMYIKNEIKYTRKIELEGLDSGLVIIDLQLQTCTRLIGVYRIFNPPGNVTQHDFFTSQLNLIRQATDQRGSKNVVVIGDFNLNEEMKYNTNVSYK